VRRQVAGRRLRSPKSLSSSSLSLFLPRGAPAAQGGRRRRTRGAREAATPRGDAWSVAFSFFLSCRHRSFLCLSRPSQAEPYHSRHHFSFGSRGSRIRKCALARGITNEWESTRATRGRTGQGPVSRSSVRSVHYAAARCQPISIASLSSPSF
jgi:hypothetical protein